MVAEWSKLLSQIQVERMPWVPGSNPAWEYDIVRSELEISCRYSNNRASVISFIRCLSLDL